MQGSEKSSGLLIPYHQLSEEALDGVIHEFVTRDGTDYGEREVSLDAKMASVRNQLKRKQAVIVFDPESETCTILPANHPAVRALKS